MGRDIGVRINPSDHGNINDLNPVHIWGVPPPSIYVKPWSVGGYMVDSASASIGFLVVFSSFFFLKKKDHAL